MSSIGQAKTLLAAASEAADSAQAALVSAGKSTGQAVDVFGAATSGSHHTKIAEVLGAYSAALTDFEEAIKRLKGGQREANSYASGLG